MIRVLPFRFDLIAPVLALAVLGLASCGGPSGGTTDEAPPGRVAMTVEQATDSSFRDRDVVVEGYFRLPFSMFVVDRTPLELYSRPNQREGKHLDVELLRVGTTGSGIVKLPSNYTFRDLRVVTDDGDTLRGGDRVRLLGRIEWREGGAVDPGPHVTLRVDSIFRGLEKPAALASMPSVPLDTALLRDMSRRNYLARAEGYLKVPSMLFAFKEYWLFLEGDFGKVGAHFVTGTGPNCLDSIPSNYKESDFKVYGADGRQIDLSKPVRVIGNFSGPDSMTTGDLSVEEIIQVGE